MRKKQKGESKKKRRKTEEKEDNNAKERIKKERKTAGKIENKKTGYVRQNADYGRNNERKIKAERTQVRIKAERLKEERNSHQHIYCKEKMMKRVPKLRQEILIFSISKAKTLFLGAYNEYV